jgi:hypothetical protein
MVWEKVGEEEKDDDWTAEQHHRDERQKWARWQAEYRKIS